MDCCSSSEGNGKAQGPTATPRTLCPACGAMTRKVSRVTLEALVVDPPSTDGWRFCGTLGCGVAYVHPDTGAMIDASRVRVVIGQKLADPNRPICYCFGWSEQAIRDQASGPRDQTAFAQISAHCSRGED